MLEALEASVNENKIPQRTLYLALINNKDKKSHQLLSEMLREEGLEFEFVLNTESHINDGICLGLNRPVAALSTSEKQAFSLKMKGYTPDLLKKKLENLALKKRSIKTRGKAAKELLSTIVPELNFTDRLLFSNPYFFGPLINSRLRNDALLADMFEIDMEISKIEASGTEINWLLPPDTDITAFKESVNNELKGIQLSWEEAKIRRNISPSQGYAYEAMQTSIRQALGDVIVIPSIKTKPGSSAYYQKLSKALLDFKPWVFDGAENERLNSGIDHRLLTKQYLNGVNFYRILFRNTLF
jgi:carboxypeptidase PM20D1